jgi:hypothetical protein
MHSYKFKIQLENRLRENLGNPSLFLNKLKQISTGIIFQNVYLSRFNCILAKVSTHLIYLSKQVRSGMIARKISSSKKFKIVSEKNLKKHKLLKYPDLVVIWFWKTSINIKHYWSWAKIKILRWHRSFFKDLLDHLLLGFSYRVIHHLYPCIYINNARFNPKF